MKGLNTAYVFPTLVADPLRLVVISRRTRASPNCKFQNNFLFCMFVKTRILSNGILGLHLNKIWTPAYSPRKNIPGFVYVHIFFSVFTNISINSKSYACIYHMRSLTLIKHMMKLFRFPIYPVRVELQLSFLLCRTRFEWIL